MSNPSCLWPRSAHCALLITHSLSRHADRPCGTHIVCVCVCSCACLREVIVFQTHAQIPINNYSVAHANNRTDPACTQRETMRDAANAHSLSKAAALNTPTPQNTTNWNCHYVRREEDSDGCNPSVSIVVYLPYNPPRKYSTCHLPFVVINPGTN